MVLQDDQSLGPNNDVNLRNFEIADGRKGDHAFFSLYLVTTYLQRILRSI